jgi:hypothetical protein
MVPLSLVAFSHQNFNGGHGQMLPTEWQHIGD